MRALGLRAGLALNPGSPLVLVEDLTGGFDLLLVMTVNPGYGGQPFIASMLPKVRRARERIAASAGPADLEVDGGVDPSNARALVEAGATVLVAGTSVFAGGDVAANVARLRAAAEGRA